MKWAGQWHTRQARWLLLTWRRSHLHLLSPAGISSQLPQRWAGLHLHAACNRQCRGRRPGGHHRVAPGGGAGMRAELLATWARLDPLIQHMRLWHAAGAGMLKPAGHRARAGPAVGGEGALRRWPCMHACEPCQRGTCLCMMLVACWCGSSSTAQHSLRGDVHRTQKKRMLACRPARRCMASALITHRSSTACTASLAACSCCRCASSSFLLSLISRGTYSPATWWPGQLRHCASYWSSCPRVRLV